MDNEPVVLRTALVDPDGDRWVLLSSLAVALGMGPPGAGAYVRNISGPDAVRSINHRWRGGSRHTRRICVSESALEAVWAQHQSDMKKLKRRSKFTEVARPLLVLPAADLDNVATRGEIRAYPRPSADVRLFELERENQKLALELLRTEARLQRMRDALAGLLPN